MQLPSFGRKAALGQGMVQPAAQPSLEELIAKAESYGRVTIFGCKGDVSDGRQYSVDIYFATMEGVELKAESGFGLGLRRALEKAIERAEKVRGQFK